MSEHKVKKIPSKLQTKNNLLLVSAIVVFAVIGTIVLLRSFAASEVFVSLQPENWTPSGSIKVESDTDASAGKYVKFGSESSSSDVWTASTVQESLGFAGSVSASETWLNRRDDNDTLEKVNFVLKYLGRRWATATEAKNAFIDATEGSLNNRTQVMSMQLGYDPPTTEYPRGGCTGRDNAYKKARLQEVIDGDWDTQFKAIGTHIKNHSNKLYENFADGRPKLIMRLAWESNGTWFCWSTAKVVDGSAVEGNTSEFKAAYRHMHDVIETAAEHDLVWAYGLNAGPGSPMAAARAAYPGDDYIDMVELDVYDNDPSYWSSCTAADPCPHDSTTARTTAINKKLTAMNNVKSETTWSTKPLGVGEWGVVTTTENGTNKIVAQGGGDNPQWIQSMYDWQAGVATSGRLVYGMYFDVENDVGTETERSKLSGSSGTNNSTWHPTAAAKFKSLFR